VCSASSIDDVCRPMRRFPLWQDHPIRKSPIIGAGGDHIHLFVALADAAPDDQALATLGAGPVEDLIRLHAENFVDQIVRPLGGTKRLEKISGASGMTIQSRSPHG